MNSPLLDSDRPTPEQVAQMIGMLESHPRGIWYAYQNHDLGHYALGHLRFLMIEPGETVPAQMPDSTVAGLGWRYVLVGRVDLESGNIIPLEKNHVRT